MLRQNMPFFKFRQQPIWGFMFDERVAVFGQTNKESNTVAFNLASIDFAFQNGQQLMIEQFALHEFRHLYQFGEIKKYIQGDYDGIEDTERIKRWAYEHEHYIGPEQNTTEYYNQDLEFDAFTFAYAAMKFKYGRRLADYIKMPQYYIGKYESIVEEWMTSFPKYLCE